MLPWTLGCMCLLELWFPPGVCRGGGLLGHMVVLLLVFWGTSILFSIVTVPVYIPTNSSWGFPFLMSLLTLICCLFKTNPFWQVWDYISLWLCISWQWMMFSIFSCVCLPSVCLLWKNVYSGPLPIFYSGCFYFFDVDLYEFFVYF